MPSLLLARCWVLPLFLLPLVVGCQVLNPSRPVSVLARDADTQQPIPGAEVSLSYPLANSYLAPSASKARTGENGLARLSATPYGDSTLLLSVDAGGYVTENKAVPVQTVQAIEPDHWFKTVERTSPNLIVELYAEKPTPTIELIVPTGYRGMIHAEIRSAEDAPALPGQRNFSYPVSPSGEILISGSALLRHFPVPDFTAQYADGTPLPRNARGAEVGLWLINFAGTSFNFFVGTATEAAMYRSDTGGRGKSSSGSGNGQGRGRRGGHSGNSSAPPSGEPPA